MLIVTIALWIIAVILITTNGEIKSVRWGSAVAFLSGLGGFSVVCEEQVVTLLKLHYEILETKDTVLPILVSVSSGFAHYLGPYCMLIFGIVYSQVFNEKVEKRLAILALIPIASTFLFFPTHSHYMTTLEELTNYYQILSIWAVPYMGGGNYFLILTYLREKNYNLKKQKLLTCIFVVPFITFSIFSNFIMRSFKIHQVWRYNAFFISVQFLCFLYFAYKYGILGIRLKFEKERLDSTMKAMTSGTAILNHSIKNEVYKISMCMNNIQNSIHKPNFNMDDVDGNIQTVIDSTEHLTAMMQRIQAQMKKIVLMENNVDLAEIIKKSLEMQRHYLRNITVTQNYGPGFIVKCDHVHITEVFNNVIKNAVEAISDVESEGRLDIAVYSFRRELVIEIKDNGIGISKENIKYVFDPFFSTKRLTMNFGLGMSYAYNVMHQHNGRLEVKSTENIGSTVSLIFPAERILYAAKEVPRG